MYIHEFYAFMRESQAHYGFWPNYEVMARNLRLNTPRGQVRWDTQLMRALPALVAKKQLEWLPCPAGRPAVRSGRCRHLALTEFGLELLASWERFGCRAHGRNRGKCVHVEPPNLLPALEHAA